MKRVYCLMILLLCATSVLLAQKKAEIEFKLYGGLTFSIVLIISSPAIKYPVLIPAMENAFDMVFTTIRLS